jgi:penicillin V acylase-like amidase (Ntn superfamily)
MQFRPKLKTLQAATAALALFSASPASDACTYVRLIGNEGSSHPGRTMEWGNFDLKPGFAIIPRGREHEAMTMPDGKAGASLTGKYGYAGVTLLGRDTLFADVINEKGLVIDLLYLPGFAEYQPYDPAQADPSLSPTDFMIYVGSQAGSVTEVKALLEKVRVVPVVEPALGFVAPVPRRQVSDRVAAARTVTPETGPLRKAADQGVWFFGSKDDPLFRQRQIAHPLVGNRLVTAALPTQAFQAHRFLQAIG